MKVEKITVTVPVSCRIHGNGIEFAEQMSILSKHHGVALFHGVETTNGLSSTWEAIRLLPRDNDDEEFSQTMPATALFEIYNEHVDDFHNERRKLFLDNGYPTPSF